MAQIDAHRELDPAPRYTDPLLALIVASGCVTTLLFALTDHYAEASAGLVAYVIAWLFVRRA
jgi:hypothetical protein